MERLNGIYTIKEQIDLIWEIQRIKQYYIKNQIPKQRQFYFKEIAEKTDLADRVRDQLERFIETGYELATKEDIADLFCINRAGVIRYLQENMSSEDLKDYENLCREQGSRRGGYNGSTKGYTQKKTWSRKKK